MAGLFLWFPIPLHRKNEEARSRLVEVAQSPGFPVHEQDHWGACDQLGNLFRPEDARLPLVVSQRRCYKGNDGWSCCSKRDLNLMQAGLSATTSLVWAGIRSRTQFCHVSLTDCSLHPPKPQNTSYTTLHKKHLSYCFFGSSFAGVSCILTPLSSVDL